MRMNTPSRATAGRLSRRRLIRAGAAAGGASTAAWLLACNRSNTATKSAPGTVSANAPLAAGVDPEKLIPDGIKKNFPQIYQYHWSRQTFSTNQPKYGGTFRTDNYSDPPNWDPTDPGYNSFAGMFQLFFNRL